MTAKKMQLKLLTLLLICSLIISPSSLAFAEVDSENVQSRIANILEEQNVKESRKAGHLYIPAGTTFEVELLNELSSKKNKKGETVDLGMVDSLFVNNVAIIPQGTIGRAVITEARKAGGFGRRGVLTINPLWIKTINGVQVPLSNELTKAGNSDGGAVVVAAAVSLVGGIFMKGTNAVYPAGTKFTVKVDRDVELGATAEELADIDLNRSRGIQIQVGTR